MRQFPRSCGAQGDVGGDVADERELGEVVAGAGGQRALVAPCLRANKRGVGGPLQVLPANSRLGRGPLRALVGHDRPQSTSDPPSGADS